MASLGLGCVGKEIMNAETLKALKESIWKWEQIIAGTGIDVGVDNCPLCCLFYWQGRKRCLSCPVYMETGGKCCSKSPYEDWADHQNEWHHIPINKYYILCPTCRRLAKEEFAFLKSLLPKDEK